MTDLLVFGGTGLLGRHILHAASGDVSATAWSNDPIGAADWHTLDLRDGGVAAAELIADLRPAAVINAAYVNSGDDLMAITGEAPGTMAAACAATGSRFVHLSTDVVFDGTTDRPYVEEDERRPVHGYGRAKARAEELVSSANPDAVIVRTSLLWGRADDPGPQVEMVSDPTMTFFTDEYRNPLEVSVLAAACLELTERPDVSGPLHIAGADIVGRYEFAQLVAPIAGVDPATIAGAPTPMGSTRPRNCPLDSSRALSLLTTPLPGVRAAVSRP